MAATELTWDLVATDHASPAINAVTEAADEATEAVMRLRQAIADLGRADFVVELATEDVRSTAMIRRDLDTEEGRGSAKRQSPTGRLVADVPALLAENERLRAALNGGTPNCIE